MAIEKQQEANRENAQQSTGPTTEEGKAISKLNAVKHGILSDAVVITKGDGEERKDAYLRLHDGLRDYFQPQGTMEDALVELITLTLWRKRRVLRFELGCLRKQLDAYRQEATQHSAEDDEDEDTPKTAYQRLAKAKEALERNQNNLEILRAGGDIFSPNATAALADFYFRLAEQRGFEAEKPEQVRDWLKQQGLTEDHIRQALIQVHEATIQAAQVEITALEPRATLELERLALLGSVPAFGPDLDKIIRYEASLDRQLYKAITQLERLQRRRKGEDLPAPVVLDET